VNLVIYQENWRVWQMMIVEDRPIEAKANAESNDASTGRLLEEVMNDARPASNAAAALNEIHKSSLLGGENRSACLLQQDCSKPAFNLENVAKIAAVVTAMAYDNPGVNRWPSAVYAGLGAVQAYEDFNHLIHEKTLSGIGKYSVALAADAVFTGLDAYLAIEKPWSASTAARAEIAYGAMLVRAALKLAE
jgi:hypothetical protein